MFSARVVLLGSHVKTHGYTFMCHLQAPLIGGVACAGVWFAVAFTVDSDPKPCKLTRARQCESGQPICRETTVLFTYHNGHSS